MRCFGLIANTWLTQIADTWLIQVDILIGDTGCQLAEFGIGMGLGSQ